MVAGDGGGWAVDGLAAGAIGRTVTCGLAAADGLVADRYCDALTLERGLLVVLLLLLWLALNQIYWLSLNLLLIGNLLLGLRSMPTSESIALRLYHVEPVILVRYYTGLFLSYL